MIDITDFDVVKEKGENLYATIREAYCPYFKEKISFNARGLEHIKFKQHDRPRPTKDQYMRFKLLHLAPEVLNLSYTLQGGLEAKKLERIRVNSRTDTIMVPVNYYEFIGVIKRNRVKVIVKQINYGEKFFWSIIPFWRMDEKTMTRLLYDGEPEID